MFLKNLSVIPTSYSGELTMSNSVSSTYALRGLRSQFEEMAKQLREMKNAVETNTLEFKKINDEIETNKKIRERAKPDWREIPEETERSRYPLVQDSINLPEVNIDLNLKKLNIL